MARLAASAKWLLIALALAGLLRAATSDARDLKGILNGQPIRLSTELLESGEYVPAGDLLLLFPKRWKYDALSGTMIFIRNETSGSVRVGLKLNDDRVVAGSRVIHTRQPPIRQDYRIYIPFYIVDTFLFPQIRFSEAKDSGSISGVIRDTIYEPMATPTPLTFTYTNDATDSTLVTPTPDPWLPVYPTPTPDLGMIEPAVGIAPNARIIIDPAHGGEGNPGAQSVLGNQESKLTLAIANKLAWNLRQSSNYEVILTRQNALDQPLSNEHRVAIANEHHGTIFISLQCGGLFSREVSWGGTYFMHELNGNTQATSRAPAATGFTHSVSWHDAYENSILDSRQLARSIHSRLNFYYEKSNIIQMNSEPRPARLAILRGLSMPGIVLELGNLMNRDTASFLSKDRVQEDIAQEIEMSISNFLFNRAGSTGYRP